MLKPAKVRCFGLIGHFRLKFLIVIFLLLLASGCAKNSYEIAEAPIVIGATICPAPEAPNLPTFNEALPFDALSNIKIMMQRDDQIRQYIKGLLSALACYKSQSREDNIKE